jgi:hypothetical protein
MRHFSDEDWLSFVRDSLPSPDREAMEEHLHSGCRPCARLRTCWAKIVETAHRDRGYQAPPEALRAAEDAFGDWRKRFVLPARARGARPFFDSLLEPLPAGVRDGAEPARRIQHRWGHWRVDLRLESEPGNRLAITGQVLKPGWQPEEDPRTGVLLMSRDRIVTEMEANSFGEFQFSCEFSPELTLFIELPSRVPIAVTLPAPGQPSTVWARTTRDKARRERDTRIRP